MAGEGQERWAAEAEQDRVHQQRVKIVCTEMCLVYVEFELRRNISFTYADMLRVYFVYLLTEYTVVL